MTLRNKGCPACIRGTISLVGEASLLWLHRQHSLKLRPIIDKGIRVEVLQVASKSHLRRFIDLPYQIYKGHPCWVPPLRIDMRAQLTPRKHPFYQHASHALFLAKSNGRDVGRIAVFHNRKHNQIYNVNIGMFGYLDMIDDSEVTQALLESSQDWLKQYQVTDLHGPYNPDINGTMGILMDTFDSPPMIMMPYNHPYYAEHLEQLGFSKIKDVWTYEIYAASDIPERLIRFIDIMQERGRFTIRKINMKHFWDEVELVKQIYNQAWAENWGALWMDDDEFTHIAKDLKMVVDPDITYVAELDGTTVGLSLTLPNINEVLSRIPSGRLLPTGLFKLLWYKRNIQTARIFILGVLKEYRNLGIDAAFYLNTIRNGTNKGYRMGEASWILEDNEPMNNALLKMGAKKVKTYRIYGQSLAGNTVE